MTPAATSRPRMSFLLVLQSSTENSSVATIKRQ